MRVKGQYMMLFSIVSAILILGYFSYNSFVTSIPSRDCINESLYSLASHNVYANCSTLQVLFANTLNDFGFIYCEKYNFTYLLCTFQNCSSLLLNASVNTLHFSISTDYKQYYVPWNETCSLSVNYSSFAKTKNYSCDEPFFIYFYEKEKLKYVS